MGKILAFLFIMNNFIGKTQVNAIGTYFSFIPIGGPLILNNSIIFGICADFNAGQKLSILTSAYYGANNFHSNTKQLNIQTVSISENQEIITSFSGSEFGLGVIVFYEILKANKFSLNTGLGSFVSFYTRADATYSTVSFDALKGNYKVKFNTRSTKDFNNLRDNLPDVFVLTFNLKLQYSITKRISIYAEPFVPVFGSYKTKNSFFSFLAANIGLTYKIKSKATHP